ncbi:MAG: HK97-gp10 family putative phage morphogenesis protein [Clostridiaceae bacterium]
MADGVTVKLEGVDALNKALAEATKQIRTKAVRSALRKAGQVISKEAKQAAPVLSAPTKTRKPGTVKKAIAVRASKFARQAGNEGVFINVRPLRGSRQKALGKAGAKNPNDPFYWRFQEFGTKKMKARPFLSPAAENKGNEAIKTFMDSVIPQIEKLNNKAKR